MGTLQLTIFVLGSALLLSTPVPVQTFPVTVDQALQNLRHFFQRSPKSRISEPGKTNLRIHNAVVQNETSAKQTPANDRVFLLPVLKAAKILGALLYMKSFHKNPFFQIDVDLPQSSEEQYYGNSYTTPYPPPPPPNYPPPPPPNYPPPPPPNYPPKYPPPPPYGYKGRPYSSEEDSGEDCYEEAKSSEEQCC